MIILQPRNVFKKDVDVEVAEQHEELSITKTFHNAHFNPVFFFFTSADFFKESCNTACNRPRTANSFYVYQNMSKNREYNLYRSVIKPVLILGANTTEIGTY